MSKKPPLESRRPRPVPPGSSPSPRRTTGIVSLFTPLNVFLLLLALAGAVAVGVTQFTPSTPAPAPAQTTATTPPTTPASTPSRFAISPAPEMPSVLSASLKTPWEGIAAGSSLPLFASNPPTRGVPLPGPGTRVPINPVDLFTDKPTTFSSPTKPYKGYSVAFCCANSAGYNGGWDGLTEAEKDTYVRSFLK